MNGYKFIAIIGLVHLLCFCQSQDEENTINSICGVWEIEKYTIDTTKMLNELFDANPQSSKDSVPVIRNFENALLLVVYSKLLEEIDSLQYVEITKEKFLLYDKNNKEVEAYSIQGIEKNPPLLKLKIEGSNKKGDEVKISEVEPNKKIVITNKNNTLKLYLVRSKE